MDHGVRTRATQGDDEPDAAVEQKMFYTIPVEADFLMAYSSTPGEQRYGGGGGGGGAVGRRLVSSSRPESWMGFGRGNDRAPLRK